MYMMVGTFSKEYWKAKILKHNIFYYKYKTKSLLEREYCILSVVLLCNTCLCDFPHDVGGGSPQYSPIPINVEIYLHIRAVQHAHKHTNTHTLTHDIPEYSIFCYKRNISINGDLKIYLFKISIKLSYNY